MPEQQPLVSILVITYNQQRFIEETVRSCMRQTYERLEIVVSDDASSDDTVAIVRKLASDDGRIKLVESIVNLGITKNCNRGLAACTGRYIALLGGDDLCAPERIAKQVAYFRANADVAACMTSAYVFGDDIASYVYHSKEFAKARSIGDLVHTYNHPPSSTLMVDRAKCADIGFDERTPVVSDWLYVIRTLTRGRPGYIAEPLVHYRRHDGNVTGAGIKKAYLADRLIAADLLLEHHPGLYHSIRRHRANVFVTAGLGYLADRRLREALRFARYSMLEYPFSARWLRLTAFIVGSSVDPEFVSRLRGLKRTMSWSSRSKSGPEREVEVRRWGRDRTR